MLLRLMIRVTTFVGVLVWAASAWATVVADWNAATLAEVRLSKSLRNGPPMVARALAIAHTCVYDAWAAYDDVAVATTDTGGSRRQPTEERTDDKDRKSTRLNSSHGYISYAVFCLKKKKKIHTT